MILAVENVLFGLMAVFWAIAILLLVYLQLKRTHWLRGSGDSRGYFDEFDSSELRLVKIAAILFVIGLVLLICGILNRM